MLLLRFTSESSFAYLVNRVQGLPLNIRASVSIKVSGVRVDREANLSDSGKQPWALIQRRTAFLQRRKTTFISQIIFQLSVRGEEILQVVTLGLLLPRRLASPVFVDTQVLSNLHCRCSVVLCLVFLHIPVILILFACRLQLCLDSDEQLRLHGGPQLRCFNHCHCQGRKFNKMTWVRATKMNY